MKILTVAAMRTLEAEADRAGQSYRAMMEAAGKAVAEAILRRAPQARRVLTLVGPGNNGGDALVAARHLRAAGLEVAAWLSRSRDDAVTKSARAKGVHLLGDERGGDLSALVRTADVILDGLLGTGAKPPLRGTIASILEQVGRALEPPPSTLRPLTAPMERANSPLVVAVDGPSGMDFDSGEIDPRTLHADLTITFAHPKRGHFRFPAAGHVGELLVAEIGIPPQVKPPADAPDVADVERIRAILPPRPETGHKGSFGRLLLVAGSANYTGAAALATQAALRSGAGLVTLALPGSLHGALLPLVPEATFLHLPHALGVVTEEAIPLLEPLFAHVQALVVGPGLTQEAEAVRFITALFGLEEGRRSAGFLPREVAKSHPPLLPPLILDADALNILAKMPRWFTLLPAETILTPHPGEMARLTGLGVAEIQARRETVARDYAKQWSAVLLLKGAFTLVAAPDGRMTLIPFANSGLAKGGSGDVLAGLIGGLRAQGVGAYEAAIAGAYLHALAASIARRRESPRGMTPLSLLRALPEAWRQLLPQEVAR